MINSEDIKEAISKKLLSITKNVAVYKEVVTKPSYPNLFIQQIEVIDSETRKNHHILTYSMDIRYRVLSDATLDTKLNQNLDSMGFLLLQNFNVIDFNDSKVRCYDKSIEKIDNVLHFFLKIDLYVYDKSEIENKKLNKLQINIGVN